MKSWPKNLPGFEASRQIKRKQTRERRWQQTRLSSITTNAVFVLFFGGWLDEFCPPENVSILLFSISWVATIAYGPLMVSYDSRNIGISCFKMII